MGRMLDALRQLDEQTHSFHTTEPNVIDTPVVPETSAPVDHVPEMLSSKETVPLDPRFREVIGAILSQVALRDSTILLMAGFASDEPKGGQLAAVYPPLAERIDGSMLVVDADSSHGPLADRLHLSNQTGLNDVLFQNVPWREAVQDTGHADLQILPAGKKQKKSCSPELLASLLDQWRQTYRLIILDAILASPKETAQWAALCDATLLTVRLSTTPRQEVQRTIEAIRSQAASILGCVLLDP